MTTETLAVTPDEREAGAAQGIAILDAARDMTVSDLHTFERAATWLRTVVVPLKGRIREMFRPRIEQAHALHKGLLADERRFLEPVEAAEKLVRVELARWEQAEAARRREAEAAAQRERERLEAEARAAAAAEMQRLQAEAETRRLEDAAALEAKGDTVGAAKLIEQPVVAPVVTPAPVFRPAPPVAAPPRVDGVSFRTVWRFRIVSEALVPRVYCRIDEQAIGAVVRAMKGRTQIPGVEVYEERVSAVKSA